MAAKTKYKVTATMIVVRVPGAQGGEVYLYRGRTLPDTVEAPEVKRLLGVGLIEKVDAKAAPAKPEDPTGSVQKGDGSKDGGTGKAPDGTDSKTPAGD